ncbi:MAG TPA: hypothetical protein PLZ62_00750 [bacterium]|nr:hypothetical protein [bacterium]
MAEIKKQKLDVRYWGLILATAVLLLVGLINLTNYFGTEAAQESISGKILVGKEEYGFEGKNQLTIDNSRIVSGQADSNTAEHIYFDSEGAAVYVDQLGYWYGQAFSSKYGMIEFSVAKNKIVKIDSEGNLSGNVTSESGEIFSFSGTTKWRPEAISEVKLTDQLQVNTDEKKRLDAVVVGTNGRDLYDVQLQWSSNQDNVKVDEYGYLLATTADDYADAVKLKVGDNEKAITLSVKQSIVLSDSVSPPVNPNLVEIGAKKDITIYLEPKDVVADSADPKIDLFKFKRGSVEITCGSIISRNNADGSLKANCDFTGKGAGDWNLELAMSNGETYEYLSAIRLIDPKNALNVSGGVEIFDADNNVCEAGENGGATTVNPDKCNKITYNLTIDKPSYLVDKKIESGAYVVSLRGQCPCNQSESTCLKAQEFTSDDYSSGSLTGSLPAACVSDLNASNGKSVVCKIFTIDKYKGGLPQGCDIVANIALNDLKFGGGLTVSDEVDVRVGVGYPKQVKLQGDVAVEGGDIDIESTNDEAKSYSMLAEGTIKLESNIKNQIKGYQINDQLNFEEVLTRLKNNISKLIVERGQLEVPSTMIVKMLMTFGSDDLSKYPEGVLYYDGNQIGDYILSNGSDINVCGPKTLVVEGRDVIIKNNIHLQAQNQICKKNGNFGLIVLDGDIKFDGDVQDAYGFYFTTGTIYTGESNKSFTLTGVAVANDFVLQRY